jgi:hypothetical protein
VAVDAHFGRGWGGGGGGGQVGWFGSGSELDARRRRGR